MGIESDQVVYEYLSRVGDVAQRRQLPSATRMRLVSELRDEIDRRRAKATADTPAAVRRIIDRLGSPDDVVEAAGGTAGTAPRPPVTAVPVQRDTEPEPTDRRTTHTGADSGTESNTGTGTGRSARTRRLMPRPRTPQQSPPPPPSAPPGHTSAAPHRAGLDELGDSATQPDWWRVDNSPFGIGDSVPGFVGGVEIPELLKPPPPKEDPKEPERPAPEAEQAAGPETAGTPRRTRWKPRLRAARTAPDAPAPTPAPASATRRLLALGGGWSNPVLLLAAGLLVAGAALGNWIALLLGWALAYASRRLSEAERKWAVVILPCLSLTAGALWLWGRTAGRWGEPLAENHMKDALAETWPWVIRGAAVTSALFLVWRSRRHK